MPTNRAQVIVAGHICLDIIPTLEQRQQGMTQLLQPGTLINVGLAVVSTGGAVSNAGLALHRLGVPTRLMGKVGDDILGHAILDVLRGHDKILADGMIVSKGEPSSYTVVISPPGVDRMFLHCPGVNDTYTAADVDYANLKGARLFHFGYPPIMRRMYLNDGAEVVKIFRRVKRLGLTTSLDMTMPDSASEAGRLDWSTILKQLLPHVDFFLPSFDEMQLMLHRHDELSAATLRELADQLLAWGAKTVALKLGAQGLYVRNATRELLAPCFKVNVVGTTGSGDCTIAGFLAALMHNLPLESAMTHAAAVGACCCEAADAISGVIPWNKLQKRIRAGWKRLPVELPLPGWQWDNAVQLWRSPHDRL